MKKIFKGLLALTGASLVAATALCVLARPPSFLRVKEVVVTSPLGRLSEFDLIRLSGVKKGEDLIRLSLTETRRNILRYPWIREVSLSKRIPGRLYLWVEEYEPVAILELQQGGDSGSELYLVSREGKVFKKLEAGDPKDFPVLTGLMASDVPQVLPRMVALVLFTEESSLFGEIGISEIRWDGRGQAALFTKDPCIRLELGEDGRGESGLAGSTSGGSGGAGGPPDSFEEKLQRFAGAWGMISTSARKPKVVDLSMDRRIVVKQGL